MSSDEDRVFVTRNGSKFHTDTNCQYLLTRGFRWEHPQPTRTTSCTWRDARQNGLVACPHCAAFRS
jgi:hypothetical protein